MYFKTCNLNSFEPGITMLDFFAAKLQIPEK